MDNNPFLPDLDLIPQSDDYSQVEHELEIYERGRTLRPVVGSEAWQILLETLKSYKDKAEDELFALPPGDPSVPTAHAAASALRQQYYFFQDDIQKAVDFAAKPSAELTDYLNGVIQQTDVLRAMNR